MTSPLVDRMEVLLDAITEACERRDVPQEVCELLLDLRELMIDLDHARVHHKRAAELGARELARATNGRPDEQ